MYYTIGMYATLQKITIDLTSLCDKKQVQDEKLHKKYNSVGMQIQFKMLKNSTRRGQQQIT